MRGFALLLMLAMVSPGGAQLRLPDIPELPGGLEIPVKIPGLDKILKEKDPISTSFDDAVTGVAYYDDFNPRVDVAMAEMPRGLGHSFMLAPGGYEVILQSYCLRAGTYGPGQGKGYLYAPLQGALGGVIQDLMSNSVAHPEIPQQDVQTLIWGVGVRAKISDMCPELQAVAGKLLTRAQINQLNGGALGRVPPELMDQVFAKLPPAAQQVMEARATLRNMLAGALPDYSALERVAVLDGEPPAEPGPEVPGGRWSYRPGGFFVRYLPDGYSRTRTQVFVPPDFEVQTDAKGRIVALSDAAGNRVETQYDDSVPPATIPGDGGVKGYALALVRLVRANPVDPAKPRQLELKDAGWVLAGTPSGKGKPTATGRFAGLAERYAAAKAHQDSLLTLVRSVRQVGQHPAPGDAVKPVTAMMVDLAGYAAALAQAAEGKLEGNEWAGRVAELPRQAWGLGLVYLGEGAAEGNQNAKPDVGEATPTPPDGTRLAAAGPVPGLLAQVGGMEPLPRPKPGHNPWLPDKPRQPRELQPFKPDGVATPARRGNQQLGQSPRPADDQEDAGAPEDENKPDEGEPKPSDKEILTKAKTAIGWISTGNNVVNSVTDPVGTIAGQIGFGGHDQFQNGFFDWLFDTASTISEQMGGDPPRADFTLLAMPPLLGASPAPRDWGADVPAARAAALNALYDSLFQLVAVLRAGQTSVDRLGGAVQAKDQQWTQQQAQALLYHKRRAGAAMIVVADRLEALVAELEQEGVQDLAITAEAYRAYQTQIQGGFGEGELRAAGVVGLTDAEIEAERQQRLALDPAEAAGSLMARSREAAASLRDLGRRWTRLPDTGGFPEAKGVAP